MKPTAFLIICLMVATCITVQPALALDTTEPRISVTAANQPLGEVLDNITGDTGYRFNLNERWEDYPVSATIRNLPLEQGLKRLLRSLNHTIIWESDKVVTIMVYGKVEPGNTAPGISFAQPPQEVPEEPEPAAEVEPPAAEASAPAESDAVSADAQTGDQGENSPEPSESGAPETPSAQAPAKE